MNKTVTKQASNTSENRRPLDVASSLYYPTAKFDSKFPKFGVDFCELKDMCLNDADALDVKGWIFFCTPHRLLFFLNYGILHHLHLDSYSGVEVLSATVLNIQKQRESRIGYSQRIEATTNSEMYWNFLRETGEFTAMELLPFHIYFGRPAKPEVDLFSCLVTPRILQRYDSLRLA